MAETLIQRLIRHEGLKTKPYHDTLGKLTIGVGRCLDTNGISEDEALYMLDNDIHNKKEELAKACTFVLGLDENRHDVLVEMGFQLGINGLLGFPKMLAALRDKDWGTAANEMLNSAWHNQTPGRVEELANIILTGNTQE